MTHTVSASKAASLGRVNVTLQTGPVARNFFLIPRALGLGARAVSGAEVTLAAGLVLLCFAIFVMPPGNVDPPR